MTLPGKMKKKAKTTGKKRTRKTKLKGAVYLPF